MYRLALIAFALAPFAVAQDGAKAVASADAPQAVAATKGTVRATIDRPGTYVPAEVDEIRIDFKEYKGEVKITHVLPHGSFVNEGDTLARFDAEAIDNQLDKAKRALENAEMDLRHAEEDARMKAEQASEQLADAQRAADRAAKKLKGYREHEMKFNDEQERLNVQWQQDRLEDQNDELVQLEKMYAEDELVDATEEIVLKRSRRNYARSVQSNDLSERRRMYNKEWYEAWQEEDYQNAARDRAVALQRLQKKLDMEKEKTDRQLEQKRKDVQEQRDTFGRLQRDKEAFNVRSPRRGILLHGAAADAPWTGRHEVRGTVRNGTVFLTVADPKKFKVTTNIEEKDILRVKAGVAAEVVATATEEMKSVGRLQVEYLPSKGGVFQAEIQLGDGEVRVRPGFTCTVSVIVEEERDAVVVPKTALTKKGGATVVRCGKTEAGPFEERTVTVGVVGEKHAAIRDGVAEGEFVVVGK